MEKDRNLSRIKKNLDPKRGPSYLGNQKLQILYNSKFHKESKDTLTHRYQDVCKDVQSSPVYNFLKWKQPNIYPSVGS